MSIADRLRSSVRIACMEVWGGHARFDGAVSVPGLDVYVGCEPHVGGTHGGDVYYVSNCAGGIITRVLLADVAGHGEEVASSAAELRDLMRRYINTPDQSTFARALNRTHKAGSGRFATALLVSYFAPTDQIIFCSAGHPWPLLYRASSGAWNTIHASSLEHRGTTIAIGARDLPLGVIPGTRYTQGAIKLEPGDILVMYSDAMTDVRAENGKPWGEAGFLGLLRSLDASDPATLRQRAMNEIRRRHGQGPDDDATMIVIHHNASDPPTQSLGDRIAVLGRMLGLQ